MQIYVKEFTVIMIIIIFYFGVTFISDDNAPILEEQQV
jgi:hypothetical protein